LAGSSTIRLDFVGGSLATEAGDKSRDVEALLSFKKTIKFDPADIFATRPQITQITNDRGTLFGAENILRLRGI
jgi:hypothetical protein